MSKILIVEDDNILSKAVHTVLEAEGYEVQLATDGEEAFKKAKKFKPDLILLDLLMPKKPGEAVLAEIRKEESIKDTPILVSTVKSDQDSIARCTALGIDGYFIKAHYTLDDILKEVKRVLNKNK